jgi:ribosomal protein S6--L-glutamate ligase
MTALAGVRIELWVEQRDGAPAVNPIMRLLLDDLAAAGAAVAVRVPERELLDPVGPRQADLVLLKTATTLGLSLALAEQRRGVRFLNDAAASLRVHDKAATLACLAAAGIAVPPTYLVDGTADLSAPPSGSGAWVSKPTRGVHGWGVELQDRFPGAAVAPTRLAADTTYVLDDGTRLVQQRAGGTDEDDLKIYIAGEHAFAGAKRFSATSFATDQVAPAALDPSLARLVRAAGEALGLRCWGLDVRFEHGQPLVIDANPFPGYRGFPAAVPALRAEIERALANGVRQ